MLRTTQSSCRAQVSISCLLQALLHWSNLLPVLTRTLRHRHEVLSLSRRNPSHSSERRKASALQQKPISSKQHAWSHSVYPGLHIVLYQPLHIHIPFALICFHYWNQGLEPLLEGQLGRIHRIYMHISTHIYKCICTFVCATRHVLCICVYMWCVYMYNSMIP